jgi:hypothetical protein
MMIRKIALAVATIATLSPVISNASPEKASVKACASAFVTSLAAAGTSVPTYRLAYHGSMNGSLSDFYPTEYTFTLEAHDPKTGLAVARARCTTDTHGAVTTIAAIPLTDKAPALAAQF